MTDLNLFFPRKHAGTMLGWGIMAIREKSNDFWCNPSIFGVDSSIQFCIKHCRLK